MPWHNQLRRLGRILSATSDAATESKRHKQLNCPQNQRKAAFGVPQSQTPNVPISETHVQALVDATRALLLRLLPVGLWGSQS